MSDRRAQKGRDQSSIEPWSPRRIRRLANDLDRVYGSPRLHNKLGALDELMFILLSSRTGEKVYLGTYECLRREFPNWEGILDSESTHVTRCIGRGGLARKKERWIRGTIESLTRREGKADLGFLNDMNDEDAEDYLTSLPGIGLKSARCILMYSLDRAVFPVDTHCRRVFSRLGIIKRERLTDQVQDEIQSMIPLEVRYSLHVNTIAHGRQICLPGNPRCSACFLSRRCSMFWAIKSAD